MNATTALRQPPETGIAPTAEVAQHAASAKKARHIRTLFGTQYTGFILIIAL